LKKTTLYLFCSLLFLSLHSFAIENTNNIKVTREQAKIEDERGWKGMTMKFVGTEGMFDEDGNMKDYEERMDIIKKRDM